MAVVVFRRTERGSLWMGASAFRNQPRGRLDKEIRHTYLSDIEDPSVSCAVYVSPK